MLSYAGVPLELDDPAALERVEAVLSLRDLRDFARRTWPGRPATMGLPWLEEIERPQVNTLYWPTGASRFSVGWFLCSKKELDLIRPLAYAGRTLNALPLVISDGVSSISTNLFMLPPRPLGQCGTDGDGFLLTLVDQRYFDWEKPSQALGLPPLSWPGVLAALGGGTVDAVNTAYLSAPADFNVSGESVPPLLDAAARSVGMVVVRTLAGAVKTIGPATALATFNANAALGWPILAGGLLSLGYPPQPGDDYAGLLPESVTVAFPVCDANGTITGEVESAGVGPPADLGGPITHPGSEPLRSSCIVPAGGGGPLASQMAADWYRWRVARPDASFQGVCPWTPGGMEDRIEWCHRGGEIWTRVQRMPWNARSEAVQFHYGPQGSLAFGVGPASGGGVAGGGSAAGNCLSVTDGTGAKVVGAGELFFPNGLVQPEGVIECGNRVAIATAPPILTYNVCSPILIVPPPSPNVFILTVCAVSGGGTTYNLYYSLGGGLFLTLSCCGLAGSGLSGASGASSGGGITPLCCPGVTIPATLYAVTALGTFTLKYDTVASDPANYIWQWAYKGVFGTCDGGGVNYEIKFRCQLNYLGAPLWQLDTAGSPDIYFTSSGSCSPFFSQSFTGVDLTACGGAASTNVTVHE